jgi:hypothetical protein
VTEEELARFALVLSEAERVRASIADDEVIARADNGDPPQLAAPFAWERPPVAAVA